MNIPTKIEANALALLTELEQSIIKGYALSHSVVLAMNELKKSLKDSDSNLSKDLEALYAQVYSKRNAN